MKCRGGSVKSITNKDQDYKQHAKHVAASRSSVGRDRLRYEIDTSCCLVQVHVACPTARRVYYQVHVGHTCMCTEVRAE